MTWTTDNRWSPGASGATIPKHAHAAYAARWIDMGDDARADVLPDRQGFAYFAESDRDNLIDRLTAADAEVRVIPAEMPYDEPIVRVVTDEWALVQRRAGGYVYTEAWLEAP